MAAELCENSCVNCNYNQGHLCRQFRYLLNADEKLSKHIVKFECNKFKMLSYYAELEVKRRRESFKIL